MPSMDSEDYYHWALPGPIVLYRFPLRWVQRFLDALPVSVALVLALALAPLLALLSLGWACWAALESPLSGILLCST